MLEKLQLSGTSVAETMTDLLKKIPGAEKFAEFLGDKMTILLVVGLVLAILGCFLGYKLKRVFHAVYLSAGFAATGAAIASLLKLPNLALILAAVVSACIGVLLGIFLHKAAFAARMLVVSTAGLYAVCCIWNQPLIGLIDGFALGLVLVILAGAYEKGIAVFYTSLAGAMEAALLLDALELVSLPGVVYALIGAGLFVVGMIVQILTNNKKKVSVAAPVKSIAVEEAAASAAETDVISAKAEAEPEVQEEFEVPVETEAEPEVQEEFEVPVETEEEPKIPEETVLLSAAETEPEVKEENGIPEEVVPAGQKVTEEPPKQEIMFCQNCGNKFNGDERFCMKCGTKRGC